MPPTPAAPAPHSAGASERPALPPRESFLALLADALAQGNLVKLVLGKHVGAEPQLRQLALRPIVLRGAGQLSVLYRYQTKDVTKNMSLEDGQRIVAQAIGASFRNAHLMTNSQTVELAISQRGQCTLRRKAVDRARERHGQPRGGPGDDEARDGLSDELNDGLSDGLNDGSRHEPAAAPHDRAKRRHVALDRPFLTGLGVADSQQRLIPAMARKYKQIDKFVEVFAGALAGSTLASAKQVRVIDFGSGKGYLTFAVHDHLVHALGVDAQVTGVELRPDMVALCNGVATRLGLEGLSFEQGDVARHAPQATDVMIALHACDTATDHAIRLGVEGGASIILCAPCCHKEVRPQLMSPHPIRAVLRHGVHLGQEADMVTDALRALLLEASGYSTQVFEFVSLEHTSKNKMILAVKRPHAADPRPWLEQVAQVKQFYGIREQALERLLAPRLGGV